MKERFPLTGVYQGIANALCYDGTMVSYGIDNGIYTCILLFPHTYMCADCSVPEFPDPFTLQLCIKVFR